MVGPSVIPILGGSNPTVDCGFLESSSVPLVPELNALKTVNVNFSPLTTHICDSKLSEFVLQCSK